MADLASPRVEALVLGALMDEQLMRVRAGDLISSSGLTADDFTTSPHRVAFMAVLSLVDRQRPTTATDVFAAAKGLPGVPEAALDGLLALQSSNLLSPETFRGHAEELRRLRMLRRLAAFHAAALKELEQPRPDPSRLGAEVAGFAESFTAGVEADETAESDLLRLAEKWDAYEKGIREPYLRTGIEILDEHMGGFVENLNVIGGLESVGKSAMVAEMLLFWLERLGLKVGLFGLEDATEWVSERHLARAALVPVGELGRPMVEIQQKALEARMSELHRLYSGRFFVHRRAGIGADEMIAKAKHWVVNCGVRAVVIDHGGEVEHKGADRDRFDLAVGQTYRALRNLAVNFNTPIIVLVHFNRRVALEQGGVPTRHNFAESAYIERLSRVALGLWEKGGDNRLRCTVLKRTKGRKNLTVAIDRDESYALLKRRGGELIDLSKEAQDERESRREARRGSKGDVWRQTEA